MVWGPCLPPCRGVFHGNLLGNTYASQGLERGPATSTSLMWRYTTMRLSTPPWVLGHFCSWAPRSAFQSCPVFFSQFPRLRGRFILSETRFEWWPQQISSRTLCFPVIIRSFFPLWLVFSDARFQWWPPVLSRGPLCFPPILPFLFPFGSSCPTRFAWNGGRRFAPQSPFSVVREHVASFWAWTQHEAGKGVGVCKSTAQTGGPRVNRWFGESLSASCGVVTSALELRVPLFSRPSLIHSPVWFMCASSVVSTMESYEDRFLVTTSPISIS